MIFELDATSGLKDRRPCEKAFRKTIGKEQRWFVELHSLEELISLRKEVGDKLIVDSLHIEIYDDYR